MSRIEFTAIADWTIAKHAGVLSFFETIALSDLEGKQIRLDAKTQRAVIGFPIFGKQLFRVNDDGSATVFRTIAFGQDWEERTYSAREMDYARLNKLRMEPSAQGPGIFSHIPQTEH
jgi:hypothetical protein|uniref:Uncharacterized protein n=1 Tax=Myoviridae sp. ctshb19 TaxID=2825194 RepID=A0A8S5UGS0_9CAUD|nr:MAG TPA: hypothetical protein [Myoviridae sp. ctshb19]